MYIQLVAIEFHTVTGSIWRHRMPVRDFHRFKNILLETKAVGFEKRSIGNRGKQMDV